MTDPQTLLAVHELGHVAIELAHRPTSKVGIVANGDVFEIEAPPPLGPEHALAGMVGGVLAELLWKSRMDVAVAASIIKTVGWRMALHSKIGRYDLELIGPAMTDDMALDITIKFGPALAGFLADVDVPAVAKLLAEMGDGERIAIKPKVAVH
jgi:hypothetical protein